MHQKWEEQGCVQCRKSWASAAGHGLHFLGVSNKLHARLHQCEACSAYWEETERFAHEIEKSEADAFLAQVRQEVEAVRKLP